MMYVCMICICIIWYTYVQVTTYINVCVCSWTYILRLHVTHAICGKRAFVKKIKNLLLVRRNAADFCGKLNNGESSVLKYFFSKFYWSNKAEKLHVL